MQTYREQGRTRWALLSSLSARLSSTAVPSRVSASSLGSAASSVSLALSPISTTGLAYFLHEAMREARGWRPRGKFQGQGTSRQKRSLSLPLFSRFLGIDTPPRCLPCTHAPRRLADEILQVRPMAFKVA